MITRTRLAVALLTFIVGLAGVWLTDLGSQLTGAVIDRLMPTPTLDAPADVALSDSTADTNAVYSAVLNTVFVRDGARLLVIERQINGGCPACEDPTIAQQMGQSEPFIPTVQKAMQAAQPDTLNDYLAQTKHEQQLKWLFDLKGRYVLVEASELNKLGSREFTGLGDFWRNFYARYPAAHGLISFSNVGFNQAHTQAFVYVVNTCGGLCGSGRYVLLEKRAGAWEIIDQMGLWVS